VKDEDDDDDNDDSIGGLGRRIRKLSSRTIEFCDSIDNIQVGKQNYLNRSVKCILIFNIIYFNLTSQYYKLMKSFLSLLSERTEMRYPIKPSGIKPRSSCTGAV